MTSTSKMTRKAFFLYVLALAGFSKYWKAYQANQKFAIPALRSMQGKYMSLIPQPMQGFTFDFNKGMFRTARFGMGEYKPISFKCPMPTQYSALDASVTQASFARRSYEIRTFERTSNI